MTAADEMIFGSRDFGCRGFVTDPDPGCDFLIPINDVFGFRINLAEVPADDDVPATGEIPAEKRASCM